MRRLVALLALVITLAVAGPASAAGELGLSTDGSTWGDSLAQPLFDAQVSWVPGDARTARFYVRNQASADGDLTVDVEQTQRAALLDSGYLDIAARVDGGAWSSLGDDARTLVAETDVAPGIAKAVDVRVTMSPDAPNRTMVLSSDLGFVVTLVDSAAGGPDGPDGTQSAGGSDDTEQSGGLLPDTGASLTLWLPLLALLLLGSGLFLVARRRKSDDTPDTTPHHDLQEIS